LIIYNGDHLKCGKCRNKMIPVLKQFVLLFVLGSFGTVSNDITVRLELAKSDLDISLMYNQKKK